MSTLPLVHQLAGYKLYEFHSLLDGYSIMQAKQYFDFRNFSFFLVFGHDVIIQCIHN